MFILDSTILIFEFSFWLNILSPNVTIKIFVFFICVSRIKIWSAILMQNKYHSCNWFQAQKINEK